MGVCSKCFNGLLEKAVKEKETISVWSRVFEKLIVAQMVEKFPASY
jgi:hypothetical protein